MPTKILSRIFLLFVTTIIFASPIAAQQVEKPRAILFGDISEAEAKDFAKLTNKLEKLKTALAKESDTTIVYIDTPQNSDLGKNINLYIEQNLALDNRIKFWGILKHPENYRQTSWETNIYLIPQGAEIPYSCILEACECPNLYIIAPANVSDRKGILTFTLKAEGGDVEDISSYRWTLSAGKIVEGQGTTVIKVDAEGAKEVTATVQVGALCNDCSQTASNTTKIQ